MKSLETIVPDLKLCKLIPKGEFADSALVWMNYSLGAEVEVRSVIKSLLQKPSAAAPTLAEILDVIENAPHAPRENEDFVTCRADWNRTWRVHNGKTGMGEEANPANAALRLWLKLEGIEVES